MIKVLNNYYVADNDKVFVNKSTKEVIGRRLFLKNNEDINEYEETEVIRDVFIPIKGNYKTIVEEKIRTRYSISDELAILRQRDTKPDEFAEYNAYCEQCKQEARNELGIMKEEILLEE